MEKPLRQRLSPASSPRETVHADTAPDHVSQAIDPPLETARAQGNSFIDLTQARGLPPIDLALLRRAYEAILG
jgi:hypothetical protein